MRITLQAGQFGWIFSLVADDGRDLLIQSQSDSDGVARSFGWDGSGSAADYLAAHVGESIDDPGYFQE